MARGAGFSVLARTSVRALEFLHSMSTAREGGLQPARGFSPALAPLFGERSSPLEIGHLRHKAGTSDFAGLFPSDALLYFWRLLNHAAAAGERNIWKRPCRSAGVCLPPAN